MDEAAAAAALLTPFDRCGEWVKEEKPLQRPEEGWEFETNPMMWPLAMMDEAGNAFGQDWDSF